MNDLKVDLKEIKNKAYEANSNNNGNEVLDKIIKIDPGKEDSKLRETLILLYSNYKAEIDMLKLNNIEIVSEMVQTNIRLIDKIAIYYISKNVKKKSNNLGMYDFLSSMPNIGKFLIALSLTMIIAISGYLIIPEKMDSMFHTLELIFTNKTIASIKG